MQGKIKEKVPSTLADVLNQLQLQNVLDKKESTITSLDAFAGQLTSISENIEKNIIPKFEEISQHIDNAKEQLTSGFESVQPCDTECTQLKVGFYDLIFITFFLWEFLFYK